VERDRTVPGPATRDARGRWLATALAALGLVLVFASCRRGAPAVPRNLLLVSIDSLRADHVHAYGYARATTPTIDRLAAEGVRFDAAESTTSWTLPAHVSLLTGRSQVHHHVVTSFDSIAPGEQLLQEAFAAQGFETIGFFSGPLLHPAFGFGRGFARYVSCQSQDTERLHGPPAWESSHNDRTNPLVEARFGEWLDRRTDARRPFFAFVHLWDVHYDYIPPEPYASLFDPAYRGPLDGRNIIGDGFPLDAPPRDVDHLRALYDGEIRSTDDTLGRLLARLDQARLLDDTLVVVLADHGEEFLDHGGKMHQQTLFEEVTRIPLIVWSRALRSTGEAIADPVSLEDVAPTALELLHLPPLDHADGRSLAPLLRGERLESRPVVSELYVDFSNELGVVAARSGATKIVYTAESGLRQEFDLVADPGEHAPREATDVALRGLLEERIAQASALLAARVHGAKRHRAQIPDDVLERLKQLGYVR